MITETRSLTRISDSVEGGALKYWLKWHIISYILRSETHRREEAFSRRHVDGTFTSDINKVLDSMAAKEYLLWVMTSKPSGER